jgi:hypothetical protein
VSGIGAHQVSCYAKNNAVDVNGDQASSPTETFGMTIREPTASAITFSKIADSLRCHRVRKRVKRPGHRATVERVLHCHARTVRRRVTVIETRHGKPVKVTTIERIVVLPHTVFKPKLRVGHGRGTTVSGYLGIVGGTPLAGVPVQVLSAPDNGLDQFTPMATAITSASGTWTLGVPPGPSRLIEAAYAGTTSVEPTNSAPVKLIVPALVSIRVTPDHTHWGGRVRIRGRLKGGFVPSGGELVILRIGYNGGTAEVGHLYAHSSGRFETGYTFLRGTGHARYRLWASTASESGYPFASARSRSASISVGP